MEISNFKIGEGRTFIIAEIGNNHNGDYKVAIEMIDAAINAGADCVKFQMRKMNAVYRKKSLSRLGEDLGSEYILDLLDRFQLTDAEHLSIANYCKEKNILYLCTPWDSESVETLESINVQAYKVASADLTNIPLLQNLINTKKILLISTGMSSEEEIQISVNFLKKNKANFILLHCNSTYPAPFQDINLNWIKRLKEIHPYVGYSGHERGISVSLAAVGLGAMVIERHFTFDRNMEGPDHSASLEINEFKNLVKGIREIESALGSEQKRIISQGEMINRENLAKSLVASQALLKGSIIEPKHIKVLSPGQGLSPQNYEKLIGLKLSRDMDEEDYFYLSDISETRLESRKYNFSRPWGIPIRYHDFKSFNSKISPDFYEFHLSYTDLGLDPNNFLSGKYEAGFIVHAPELFSKSRLMDLASADKEYRKFSIQETQRVIEVTKELKNFFTNTKKPLIVANIGGFTMDKFLSKNQVSSYYERFAESLESLNLDGVELIPQTMAPFPWHFGGQRFQNLFVHSDECIEWCEKLGLRMCFDTSHSKLMCNHFGLDFYKFSEQIAPYTAHLHIGDAIGVNGEGLQIGMGDIDFSKLAEILRKFSPNISFIPEIWQGHKNNGEGFWLALERLELVL